MAMSRGTRKFVRVTKFLLAGMTVFCVSWIANVNEWHTGLRWNGRRVRENLSTMRTIVGYSEAKLAELDRPSPVHCIRLPAFPKITITNRTWTPDHQTSSWQHVTGTSVSLYAAYYDGRTSQHYVRIIGNFHGRNMSSEEPVFCQTRSINPNKYAVEVVAAKPHEMWWHEWDNTRSDVITPVLLSCPLTEALSDSLIVSVVTQPCEDPSNGFNLVPTANYKYDRTFTICVKDMKFHTDIPRNLVEWVETNKLLGVDMIDMYIDSLSKENEKVLFHYRSQGFIRLFQVPIKHSSGRSVWQRRRDHIITYNDCLYRNIKESEFIVPLDVDEIVLPKVAYTWRGLIKRLTDQGWSSKRYSAIMIRNVFFFDFLQNIRNYKSSKHTNTSKIYIKRDDVRINDDENLVLEHIELLDNTNRSYRQQDNQISSDAILDENKSECGKKIPVPKLASHVVSSAVISPIGHYSKSFMLTKRVLTAFNHYPLASLASTGVSAWSAPFNEVQLNHYKSGKTCITNYLSETTNMDEAGTPRPTQGVRIVEFELSELNINNRQYRVDIEMWDCSGDHKFESCWPALRLGLQGVILVCSPNTANSAARELELLYNYFVSQAKLSTKQCVVFYNCEDDQEDIDSLNLSPTFSKVSQVIVNLKTGGNRLRIDFTNYITSILHTINKVNTV